MLLSRTVLHCAQHQVCVMLNNINGRSTQQSEKKRGTLEATVADRSNVMRKTVRGRKEEG